jgi:hypothetical protein
MLHLLVVASRNSLIIGFGVAMLSIVIGFIIGIFSGYFGGHFVDNGAGDDVYCGDGAYLGQDGAKHDTPAGGL